MSGHGNEDGGVDVAREEETTLFEEGAGDDKDDGGTELEEHLILLRKVAL